MALSAPFHLQRWIDAHRDRLKPPVGNAELYEDHEFIVMVVGGPNSRTDFHVDPGEELFYMLEGDMVLRVLDEGALRDVEIKEGEIFLLPALVPHSPQRRAGTVGLVVERRRRQGELDGFCWYCARCSALLYVERFALTSIVRDLPPIFERYEAKEENRTCRRCGWVMPLRAART